MRLAILAFPFALSASGGYRPPNAPTWIPTQASTQGEPRDLIVQAFDEADFVYTTIADTPIKDLEVRSEEIGARVTRARDLWRRAMSYDLSAIHFQCGVAYESFEPEFPVGSKVFVPIEGHRVRYEVRNAGGSVSVHVASSRGKTVANMPCSDSPRSDTDFGVHDGPFGEILASDGVSIPDLILNIKR